jgi:hypothetical protein
MDQSSFDRLATALGSAASRRAGLAAALGAAFGLGLGAAAESSPRSRRPAAAGPCGDGSRAENRCTKNKECCTGICDTSKGKTNKDGEGRCRCRKKGQDCTADKNCCSRKGQAMICLDGVCSPPCTALGQVCDDTSTCCAGQCTGILAENGDRGKFALPTCCLNIGQSGCANDADCCGGGSIAVCTGGTCSPACTSLGGSCATTVCCAPSTCGGSSTCCYPDNTGPCGSNADCCSNFCNSGICSSAPSDSRLKERIEPLDNGLDLVTSLRPVRWDWTDASGLAGTPRIGFIAQEVRQVVPEVVGGIGGDYLGIDYAKLVAVLTGAVQEQQAEIAALRARLDALETTGGDHCRQA